MKIFRKIFKFLFTLFLLAVLGCSGYVLYDYYQNPAKYDDFAQLFLDKATGKDKITIEEVSPFLKPEMTLTLDNSQFAGMTFEPHEDFEPMKPIILCYGKDMGGDLYVPIPDYNPDCKNPRLYGGPSLTVRDISEYASFDAYYRHLQVREELMRELEAGEYYIIADFANQDGTGYYEAASALIVEEETTFNSTQRGFVTYGDEYAWIINDLEEPRDISFTFYNLGDNPIRALLYDSDSGGGYLTEEVDPEDYSINARGDSVTLKAEALAKLPVNTTKKFAVRLANGDILDMGWTVVGTVKGDSLHRMTISGPATYSLSAGGDYIATIVPNDCTRYYSCTMNHYPSDRPGTEIFFDTLKGREIGEYADTLKNTITVPAELLQDVAPHDGIVSLKIGYFIGDVWFDAFLDFEVVE